MFSLIRLWWQHAFVSIYLPGRTDIRSSLALPKCPSSRQEQNVRLWLSLSHGTMLTRLCFRWSRSASQNGCAGPEAILPLNGNLCSCNNLTSLLVISNSCGHFNHTRCSTLPSVTTASSASSYLWFSHHPCKCLLNEPPTLPLKLTQSLSVSCNNCWCYQRQSIGCY